MNYRQIIKRIAKENHTTPEEVEYEMQKAIDAAYDNPDPQVKAMQQKIPCKGERPTPEEFIFALAALAKEEKG